MKNPFIRAIQEQPWEKSDKSLTKLNIHIPIRGQTLGQCVQINSQIRSVTESFVDFSPVSYQVPHITLYMGYVSSAENYCHIMNAVSKLAAACRPFEIAFTGPYLKTPKRTYAFVDTHSGEIIIDLKRKLEQMLSKNIEPLSWNVVEEDPHVTIGYIKEKFDEIEILLKKASIPSAMNAEAIEVSFCGPYGSCLGSIRCFEFGV